METCSVAGSGGGIKSVIQKNILLVNFLDTKCLFKGVIPIALKNTILILAGIMNISTPTSIKKSSISI